MVHKPRIIFLTGPTAVGKTAVAIAAARKLNAEIISCDSMQVYRGMDIITSKSSAAQRKRVRHHLIDVVAPDKEYDVSRYRREALRVVRDIVRRGKTPLFVGGTGLYLSVLLDGIFKSPKVTTAVREGLYQQAHTQGSALLHARLHEIDPDAAARIHPHDTRRIVRALEVYEATGTPISVLQKQRTGLPDRYDVRVFGLTMDREALYERIGRRVDAMFARGLVREVGKLLTRTLSKTARHCIGIEEVKGHLDGRYDLNTARDMMKQNTRNYAKRQMTWFRKVARTEWMNVDPGAAASATARQIVERIE